MSTSISNDQLAVRKGITDLLICPLCSNWYREAMTIPECLHTFCKECLYGSFNKRQLNQTQKVCPMAGCGVVVGKDIYKLKAIYDRNIQAIVDRLCCEPKEGSTDRVAVAVDSTASSGPDSIAGRKATSARLKANEDGESQPVEDKLMTVLIGPTLPNVHLAIVPHPSFIRATLEKSESFPLKKFTLNPNLKMQIRDIKTLIQSEFEKVLTRHQKQYLQSLTILDTFNSPNNESDEFEIDINNVDRLAMTVHTEESQFDICTDEERLLASATMRGFNGDKDEEENAKVYGKVMRYVLKYHMKIEDL